MKKIILPLLVLFGLAAGIRSILEHPTFQLFGDAVARIDTDVGKVAITFDDGPTSKYTPEVLATLAAFNVKATFFITGQEADRHPDALKAIVDAGHELGNHSYTHSRLVFVRPARVRQELAQTDAAILAAGYTAPTHFRPPYGKRFFSLPWVLSQQDRLTVMWDVDGDPNPAAPAEQIVRNVVDAARPGSIIILHPMFRSRETTRAALPDVIQGLRDKGLEPVTLSELLALR